MSSIPQKMKKYDSFFEWKEDQLKENQNLINILQDLIEKTAPKLTTTVKWGQGCWVDNDAPRVFIHTEDDHVQLGFYNGSSLEDPQRLLSGSGKYVRFVKIHYQDDIDPEAYGKLIEQATTSQ